MAPTFECAADPAEGLPGMAGRSKEMDVLLFGVPCIDTLAEYLRLQKTMLGIVVAVVAFCYLAAFRTTITSVRDDARRTTLLLLMIPSDVIASVDSIRQSLVRKATVSAAL
eukprot:tig00001409_g8627.t1